MNAREEFLRLLGEFAYSCKERGMDIIEGKDDGEVRKTQAETQAALLTLFDAATAVQGGEPVAWRFPNSTHWRCCKTNPPDEWALISGVEYAYAAAPPAARQDEGREE